MAVNLHWCGGKLSSLELNSLEKPLCGCGKKSMKPDCCENSHLLLKASDELAKVNNSNIFNQSVFSLAILTTFFHQISQVSVIQKHTEFKFPPPLVPKEPLFKSTCAFLI